MESKFKTVTKHKRREDLTKDDKTNLLVGMAIWAEFWRKNPHRFVEDYLQLHLFLFQKILLYFMMKCDYFVFIACRGLGKSFLTAVFCITRCILYPGTKIIVVSGNKEQAGLIITEKIKELKEKSVMLNKEIKKIREGEDPACFFKNGSYIRVSTSGDGARGKRGNVLIVDEYRLVKEENLNSVLKQFLTAPRRPGFYDKPGYEDYPTERNKELYLSSAWYKSHWSWKKFLTIFNRMVAGKNSFACDIPFECSIDHKLLTQEKIDDDREEIGEVRYLMEYCGIWYGENEKSYFKSDELNNCRVLQKAFYPLKDYDLKNPKALEKHAKQMPKLKGEIRIMGCDIALEEGAKNDNSIYVLMRMIPSGGTYHREVVYMESHNGLDAQKQALRIKQLFFEFKCDKMIIDINGNGSAVLTNLQQSQYDSQRDTHYEKFDLFNKPKDVDMDLSHNGLQVMYGMRAYERENNDCMVFLKNAIINGKLRLLLDDLEKKNDMATDKRFHTDGEYASDILKPFIEITKMIHEMINLEYEVKDKGNIGIVNGSGRKDRYSAIAYCNYLAEIIEKDEIKKQSKDDFEFMFFD